MEDKVTISLTEDQRKLLLKYEPFFNDIDLFRFISIAVKKDKRYELYFDEKGIRKLLNHIAKFSYNEQDKELEYQLDELGDYLMYITDAKEDDDYSEHSYNTGAVCTLKISLAYEKKIWRKIAIREGQTLHDLHDIIFEAFDRYDEHMYSFYIPYSRKKFNPRTIRKYSDEFTHPYACEDIGIFGSEAQDASEASIESLGLIDKQKFYYLFDFGDEWWHEITVERTENEADDQEYPRILERKGESPEQYPDYDEDDDCYYDEN